MDEPRKFLLTRLLRGVTAPFAKAISCRYISTHTPLARRDKDAGFSCETFVISTHTPLARRDCPDSAANVHPYLFLLTRLLRGVTAAVFLLLCFRKFLLTRLLRGVTEDGISRGVEDYISTHTPLARRDGTITIIGAGSKNFYSHASCEA